MKIIRGVNNIPPELRGCVATIGNFDGIHLGHRALLEQLASQAKQLNKPVVVITFEPHPQEYFGQTIPRLTRLREKLLLLQECQVDAVLCLRFNEGLAQLTPEQFIQINLVDGLRVAYLLVGNDFRFGHQRSGDFATLKQFAKMYGFTVEGLSLVRHQQQRVSSSYIRHLLTDGYLTQAQQLLGRCYSMSGRVIAGAQRGTQLGIPTANIDVHRLAVPVQGVYAVQAQGIGSKLLPGVANVGNRPTVDGVRSLLEVHLLDFQADIYHRYLQVYFLKKLRDENKYESLDLLKQQIEQDIAQARAYFSALP